jgi:signal transduction histidine kinase/ActR/RegA family two-component response regulator
VLTGIFVTVCQLKINVTNAYAGSIAASNFFSRLTHRHPGRVIWLVFNMVVAVQLMELGIVNVVAKILALYANFAVAWIGAVAADLVVNKPLGLSPKGIEFKRAHLYDINPVGVGAMALSLIVSTALFLGLAGPVAQAFAPIAGLVAAFAAAPLIAVVTRGRFYLARPDTLAPGARVLTCTVCENTFERADMAHCPVYQGAICSLCCTLEARCHDACKVNSSVVEQASGVLGWLWPGRLKDSTYALIVRFLGAFLIFDILIGVVFLLIYQRHPAHTDPEHMLRLTLGLAYICLVILSGFSAWFLVLAGENKRVAQTETARQTAMLLEEIEAHRLTDEALQKAKEAAEAANLAKSRYIVGLSHEIRSPLNAISGYAQLLERSPAVASPNAVQVIRRSATHMTDLIEGLLESARIENGALAAETTRVDLVALLNQVADMFRLQAAQKGLSFQATWADDLPVHVHTDEKRLRQILINLLSNAIKYTDAGWARLVVDYDGRVARFAVSDTGVGFEEDQHERIFEPFHRLQSRVAGSAAGLGLGLTITKALADLMDAQITVASTPGQGSCFTLTMALEPAPAPTPALSAAQDRPIVGHHGRVRKILATDDDPVHLDLLREWLQPAGFALAFAEDGQAALAKAAQDPPDLVLMDISMPGMDGWEAARRLRAAFGDRVAILMLSANAHDFSAKRRGDDPHDDFLIKPYDAADLFERVAVLLDIDWVFANDVQEASA